MLQILVNPFPVSTTNHLDKEGDFAGLPTDAKAPLIGANDNKSGQFDIPVSPDNPAIKLTGFDRFITTKGGAYCFIPSITALQHIASHSTK